VVDWVADSRLQVLLVEPAEPAVLGESHSNVRILRPSRQATIPSYEVTLLPIVSRQHHTIGRS